MMKQSLGRLELAINVPRRLRAFVRGARRSRDMRRNVVVMHSEGVNLAAHCVQRGRWNGPHQHSEYLAI